jgi:hypothetical protein
MKDILISAVSCQMKKTAFQQREPQHIPANKIRFSENQNQVIID